MIRRRLLPILAAMTLCGSAVAEESGGVAVTGPGLGLIPALPQTAAAPPHQTPGDVRAANPARARQGRDQAVIAQGRGDAGFLAGFHQGRPLAQSRQPPPEPIVPNFVTLVEAPFIVNNIGGPVSIGLGSPKDGEAAVTPPPATGSPTINNINSAVNVATGSNNIASQNVTIGR